MGSYEINAIPLSNNLETTADQFEKLTVSNERIELKDFGHKLRSMRLNLDRLFRDLLENLDPFVLGGLVWHARLKDRLPSSAIIPLPPPPHP